MIGSWCLLLGMLGANALIIYIIAADEKRFLASFDLSMWQADHYVRNLSNFLQTLQDHRFSSPWPRARHAVAAWLFRLRTWRLRRMTTSIRPGFVREHIAFHALLEILRPYIQDFLLEERQHLIGDVILSMEDTGDRDRLMAFLEGVRAYRAEFHEHLTSFDRAILVRMVDQRFISTLRMAHAVFQEHGYSLLPELTQLREWESMTGTELAQDLPVVPVVKSARQMARRER